MNNLFQRLKGLRGLAFDVLQTAVGSIKAACHTVISEVDMVEGISHFAWISPLHIFTRAEMVSTPSSITNGDPGASQDHKDGH